MSFVLLMIVGAAAGFLATRLMKIDAGVPATIAIGIGGAIIGGVLIRFLLEITAGWRACRRGLWRAAFAVDLENLYRGAVSPMTNA